MLETNNIEVIYNDIILVLCPMGRLMSSRTMRMERNLTWA